MDNLCEWCEENSSIDNIGNREICETCKNEIYCEVEEYKTKHIDKTDEERAN